MIVRELLTRLGFKVDDTQLKKYNAGIKKTRDQAESAADSIRNMFAAFVGFQGLASLVAVADEVQSIEARIKQLPQTVGDVGAAFNDVAARASNAKQGISEYASFYIKAGNATQDFIKNQSDLLNIVDGAAFGLAASGASAVSQSQAFFQLGQAIGSPVVQMEEMNTLIDVAPDLFRALGKAIPGANGQLKKFISTGSVTGKMLAEGLIKVAPIFEKKMKEMPMAVGTAGVLIKNRWKIIVGNLNRESQAVTSVANFMLSGFDKVESGFKKIVEIVGGAKNAVKLFGITLAAIAVPVSLYVLAGLMTMIMTPTALLIGGLILVGLVIEDIYQAITGGQSVSGGFIDWLKEGTVESSLMVAAVAALTAGLIVWAGVVIASSLPALGALIARLQFAVVMFGLTAASTIAATLPLILMALAVIAVVAAFAYLYVNSEKIMAKIKKKIDELAEKWRKFKSLFGGGVSTSIDVVSNSRAALLASNAGNGGVAPRVNYVTLNQTLPAGTTAETKLAARQATENAFNGFMPHLENNN